MLDGEAKADPAVDAGDTDIVIEFDSAEAQPLLLTLALKLVGISKGGVT